MTTNPLFGVRVKIDRAKHHLGNLETAITRYHGANPYAITADVDTESGQVNYRFHYLQPIPCEWGGVVGEIVHALRSSLDNLATALAVHNGRTSNTIIKNTYFPIGTTKESFDRKLPCDLKGASATARRLAERMKPYKGGTDAFWILHQLDILDKHTALIPVGTGRGRVGIKFPAPPMFPDESDIPVSYVAPELPMVHFDLAVPFPLKHGEVIFGMGLGGSALKIGPEGAQIDTTEQTRKKKTDLQFTFEIAFGEGQIIDGEPVIPALKQLIDFTERVADIFARHIFKTVM